MNELHELRSRLWDHPALSLDLETTSRDPSAAQLEIVAMAAGYGPSLYAVALPPTTEVLDFVVECLNDPRLRIVGHNLITYDLVVLHHRNIFKFGTAKARLVDTLPLVWLLDENADHGLKYSSKRYLDHTMVEYEEAFLTSASYMRSKELELTKARLNHEFEMTVKGLEKDRKTDKNRLMAELKTKFKGKKTLEDRIDKLALTGKISRYLDNTYGKGRINNLKAKLDADCAAIDKQIEEALKQWNIDKYMYAADDARQTLRLYRTVRSRLKAANLLTWADIEIKNRVVAAEMKMEGVPFLPSKVSELKSVVVPLINEFEWQMFDIAKTEFNPNSPQQVKRILYDVVGVPPIDGSYSTDEKALSRMYHPIAQALLNYRTVSKLNSTYIVRMEQELAKGLPTRLRAIFNTIGTVTGRWSSSKPNLQNIPSKSKPAEYDPRIQNLGPKIREAFSGLTEDLLMISADLSQIELRIIAHITQDARLLDVYNQMTEWNGLKFYTGDIHKNTSEALNIPRKIAKNCNFGLCLRKGTQILTSTGHKNIEDVRIDDLVYTHKGRWRPVIALQRPVTRDLIRVQTATGKVLESTPDHMHYRYFPKANGLRGGYGWVPSEDLERGDYLCYHGHGYSEGRPVVDYACRLLGWYLSEGSYQNYRLKISQTPSKNPDVASKMHETLIPLGFQWYDLEGSSPHLSASVGIWQPILRQFEIDVNAKSGDKQIPESVFGLNEKARLEILGSLWDGDGSVNVSRGRGQIQYYSKSPKLLQGIVKLLDSVGIDSTLDKNALRDVHSIRVVGSKSKQRFLSIVPTVKTKRHDYCPKKQFDSDEKITSTKHIRLKDTEVVYDLTVAEDHSFVANGLVTHNCYGMGATKFARYAKLFIEGTKNYDFNKSRMFVDQFMGLYCGIQETLDRIDGMLNNTDPKLKRKSFGLITGRRRHFTDNDRPFPGMVLNTIVQGSAADLLKIIVWYIYSCVVKHPDFAGTIFPLQVHDEVGLFAPRAIAEKVAIMVKYIMERPWFKLDVPVLASVKVCDCWADKDNDDIPEIGVMPPKDTKIKPCVAMLTPEQETWAATYLPNVVCYSAK